MNTVLLFVAAEPRECVEWTRHWDDARAVSLPVHWARAGKWKGRDVIAIANGAGAERAYQAVKAVPSVAAVCSIGFCGGLGENLKVGEVVHVSEVRSRAGNAKATPFSVPIAVSGHHGASSNLLLQSVVLESVDHIVATAQEKRTLRERGASVVEMEAAGVARAARELNIPFYCVRVVSDLAEETFANDFGAALLPDGRISVARLLRGAMASPVKRFGELIRLGRRTAAASKNLGDFLANCSF